MLRESHYQARRVRLNFAEGPASGPPMVLVHGGGARWQYLRELAELLSSDWHVYAPDLRGHGGSGRVPHAYNLSDYVTDLADFIRGLVGRACVLFGHSLGGEIGVMLAARCPELVRALIVGDAPLSIRDHVTEEPQHRAQNKLWHGLAGRPVAEIESALRRMPLQMPGAAQAQPAEEVMGADHAWFRLHSETLHHLDPDMLAAVLTGPEVMLAGYDPHLLLPAIRCPTLLLQADPHGALQGGVLRDDEVALGLRLLPDTRHVRLEGVGHPLNDAPAVLAAIQPFLAQLAPADEDALPPQV